MPRARGSEQFPSAFNALTFEKKQYFAFKARENEEYLTKIIEWLKDTTREHIQEEDDRIILSLHSKVDRLITEGIILPPPYIRDYFHYTKEVIDYSKKYFENPHRDATYAEKKQMVWRIITHSSYVDKDINNLLDYSMVMPLEYNSDMGCNILNRLELLQKTTVDRLFQHWISTGELLSSDFSKMKELLAKKLEHWNQEKERKRTIYRNRMNYNYPGYIFNIGIENYTYAVSLIEKMIAQERSRELHTVMKNAGPNSHLYKLPANLYSTIIEYNTGLKHGQYGGKSRRIKRRRRSTRKVRK
jgi:hypothetical protein